MKKFVDRKRHEWEFEVGDYVYLKLHPYRQTSVVIRHNEKLSSKYFGLYCIEERVGKVAYRLILPTGASTHPVFHALQLKKALGPRKIWWNQFYLPCLSVLNG